MGPVDTNDTFVNRVNAVGMLLIALIAIVGGGTLLYFRQGDTAIAAFVSGVVFGVMGHYFGSRASAQGANTTNGATKQLAQLLTEQVYRKASEAQAPTVAVTNLVPAETTSAVRTPRDNAT